MGHTLTARTINGNVSMTLRGHTSIYVTQIFIVLDPPTLKQCTLNKFKVDLNKLYVTTAPRSILEFV